MTENARGAPGQLNPEWCTADWLEPTWPVPSTVRALSTFRSGGSSLAPYASLNLGDHVGDSASAVAQNRAALLTVAGLPAAPRWLEQVHGRGVLDLDHPVATHGAAGEGTRLGPADAAVTRRPGTVCAILTADCLPVLLAGIAGDCVGVVHAGWRGLAMGVIEATVAALQGRGAEAGRGGACADEGRSSGTELIAWLGPAIGPERFEIGPEVREALLAGDPPLAADPAATAAAFKPASGDRYLADLYALARSRLAGVGVTRVYGGGECTHSNPLRYFSHRRDGRTGRQATLIWLENPQRR